MRCRDGHLSEEVAKINVGSDAPYRMAIHPSGKSLVLGLTLGGVKKVDIKLSKEPDAVPELSLGGPEFDAKGSAFGAIKALSFSMDGRLLALGGEDGSVEIVSWPSMESQHKWSASEKGLRNLDFSAAHSDGVVASVDESGACKLWDVSSGGMVAQLQPPADLPRATFFRCKSAVDEDGIALYTPVKFKGEGYVLRWRQEESGEIVLEKKSGRAVTPSPICGFETSTNGALLAAVTPDGDQCVISAATLRPVKYRKGAHMTFATAVAFAPDDSAILSTSADASATLTMLLRSSSGGGGGGIGGGGGVGSVLVLLAVLLVIVSLILGMLRQFAEQSPLEAMEFVNGLPEWIQHLVMPLLSLKK